MTNRTLVLDGGSGKKLTCTYSKLCRKNIEE